MNALYLCYQSLLEPLTQTQVVAYLEGLAGAGYGVVLLTFEPSPLSGEEARSWGERLAGRGITWYQLRYHKRPTVPATAWDVLAGVATGLRLIRRHRVDLVHTRAHVPGVMGVALKRLAGVKLLFDVRGLMAEEYADAGAWPAQGPLFRLTKRAERAVVGAADAVVVLTEQLKDLFLRWYPEELAGKSLEVIPCCVDRRGYGAATGGPRDVTMVYAGKLGGWYPADEMAGFYAAAKQVIPGLKWRVLSQSDPAPLRAYLAERQLDADVSIGRVPPDELPAEFGRATAGLCFYRRNLSGPACSPTKVAEYLSAGLPVVCTAGIGDTDAVLNGGGRVGVLIRDKDERAYRRAASELKDLLDDPETPARCRAVAEERFDLERVGWPRYVAAYRAAAGRKG